LISMYMFKRMRYEYIDSSLLMASVNLIDHELVSPTSLNN
jgi:hypothetical protein